MPNMSNSVQPRKQRLARAEAPLHTRRKQMAAHLSEMLILRYNRRSLPVVRGDVVKVMRGAWRGHEEKVASVDLGLRKVTVEGVTITKADGKKKARPLDPSNLVILKLNLTDKLRRERLTSAAKLDEATRAKLREELEAEAKAQAKEIERFRDELAEREAAEKAERAKEGGVEAAVDPVTQKPEVRPKEEREEPAHAGGDELERAKEAQAKKAEESKEEKS